MKEKDTVRSLPAMLLAGRMEQAWETGNSERRGQRIAKEFTKYIQNFRPINGIQDELESIQ